MKPTLNLLPALLLACTSLAHAFEPATEKVTDNVYAIVGELDQRTAENQGLNNTTGFIITDDGVVLIGSGATEGSAKMLEAAVKKVTDKPIKQVLNIGVQDHHWMGNSHFLAQKIPVSALAKTVESQQAQEPMNRMRLSSGIGGKPEDLKVEYPSETFDGDEKTLTIGGVEMSLRYLGDAHFPGDAVLWLPKEKIVFTGDIVFNERMLGVLPEISRIRDWQATFKKVAELQPAHVVPGHGTPSDLASAQKNTGDYLDWLVTEVGKSLEEMEDLGDAVKRLSADETFSFLKLSKDLHGRNVHQTYLQLEAE
ncbi:MAG: MBL fold metallo-hydrolase [Gammaproteobacteria bacterium]|nr:MBL fold metallo-hydrolase [Gammaproteobacteria bacterium]MBU1724802.1 MBL fold metallo-hydrolase [Gammaproteobacteria bacterium]MBU2006535.1 MBL fold metallo-hydrolase [Gammaproteobacteria bacterium]